MAIVLAALVFFSEYLDSAIGMGYGTALVPAMLFLGYSPLKVIPAILISQLATDIVTFILHHKAGNVDLRLGSQDLKAAAFLGMISSVGVVIACTVAMKIPKEVLSFYIGIMVFVMGVFVIFTASRPMAFSWRKLMMVSFVASFNKGISGGGYGPLVMGGQMLSGVDAKKAVGITAFAEGVTCLVGFLFYLIKGQSLDWGLIGFLTMVASTLR